MVKKHGFFVNVIGLFIVGFLALSLASPVLAARLPDLKVSITAPAKTMPGADISDQVKITVRNVGNFAAKGTISGTNGYMVDIVLAKSANLPVKLATYSERFKDGALLRGGRVSRTRTLKPGAKTTYTMGATIPANTPPGRYCLGIIVDPGKKVKESRENNNVAVHWIQIGEPAPKRFLLHFPDAYLVHVPETGTIQVAAQNKVISYGGGWQVRKLKSYLYHFKRDNWQDFFWKVNTSRKEVYLVKDGTFGQLGGTDEIAAIDVDVVGVPNNPTRFLLRFSDAYLVHVPESGTTQIATQKKVVSYGQKWQVKQLKPYLYHVKRDGWQGFYWKVNTSREKVYLVKDGTFGQLGGTEEVTPIRVEVVE